MKGRLVLYTAAALAVSASSALAVDPMTLGANAKIACGFEADLVFGRKLDTATVSKYVTAGYIEHNVGAYGTGIPKLQETLGKMPKFPGPASGCGDIGRVIEGPDSVVFIREGELRDDPKNPGQKVRQPTHFDVFRFEGGKIAEHWD